MSEERSAHGRRHTLGLLLGLPLMGAGTFSRAQSAALPATGLPDGVNLLAAGPEGGALDSWAKLLAPHLRRVLPAEAQLRLALAGGIDGVTGANQFHTSAQPDGFSLLLNPGTAALAWLSGDPRVHFDAGRWIALLAGLSPAVLISRFDPRGFRRGQALRIAVAGPQGCDIATRLGLELAGLTAVAVAGPADEHATLFAFAQHAADLLVLRGPGLTAQIDAAIAAGGQPICVLGLPDAAKDAARDGTTMARDPALPALPHLAELAAEIGLPMANGPLAEAWTAVALAAQLQFALVLPPLTTAVMVALWRRAADHAIAAAEVQAAAAGENLRLRTHPGTLAAINADSVAIRELQRWLVTAQQVK